jgi:hypothetical protein
MIPWNSLLLVSMAIFQVCVSFNSTPMQVDLVFPRDSGIYQRAWPFPIIFAFHNLSAGWDFNPTFYWRLGRYQTNVKDFVMAAESQIGWIEKDVRRPGAAWGAPSDNFISMNFTDAIISHNESQWRLRYGFVIGKKQCTPKGTKPLEPFTGYIYFNTTNATSMMPNIAAAGPCAVALDTVKLMGVNQTDASCPSIMDPSPEPKECAFKINDTVVDQVLSAAAEFAGCEAWDQRASKQSFSQCRSTSPDSMAFHAQSWSDISRLNSVVLLLSFLVLIVCLG